MSITTTKQTTAAQSRYEENASLVIASVAIDIAEKLWTAVGVASPESKSTCHAPILIRGLKIFNGDCIIGNSESRFN